MIKKIPIVIMRGGTSRSIFIKKEYLPEDEALWESIFLQILGSNYESQTDNLGCRDPLTTKIAIVSESLRPEFDMEYTFFQVGVYKPFVTFRGNCGNLSSALGVFAVEEGYIEPKEPYTSVKVYNKNTDKAIEIEVPITDGRVQTEGDYSIDGVKGTGARIDVNFPDTGGTITGRLFPSGNRKDILTDGIPITIIDSGSLSIIIQARYLGLQGTENPYFLEENEEIIGKVERIRKEASDLIDFVPDIFLPKLLYITTPKAYTAITGKVIKGEDIDITSRYFSQTGIIHKSYPVAGGIALATAAHIEGTVVEEIFKPTDNKIRIGHPSGVSHVSCQIIEENERFKIDAKIGRTARRIMEGHIYIRV